MTPCISYHIPPAGSRATGAALEPRLASTGYSPTGDPLSHAILREPLDHMLSGTPPDLTYMPADNFEGLDTCVFEVSDGGDRSPSAEATMEVVSGTEATPPGVWTTHPRTGAVDEVDVYSPGEGVVRRYATPVDDDVASGTKIVNDAYSVVGCGSIMADAVTNGPPVTSTVKEMGMTDSYCSSRGRSAPLAPKLWRSEGERRSTPAPSSVPRACALSVRR